MKIKLKNATVSAFFGALGPYFNKQATLDQSRFMYHYFLDNNKGWLIYPFDAIMIFLMLWANTVSVRYKMLSYKYDGAFIGTTLIFVLGYIFSSGFDYLLDQNIMPIQRIVGALMIITGVILISFQEQEDHVKKKTPSVYEAVGEELKEEGQVPYDADEAAKEELEGGLIDRSKPPTLPPSPLGNTANGSKEASARPTQDKAILQISVVPAKPSRRLVHTALDFHLIRKGY